MIASNREINIRIAATSDVAPGVTKASLELAGLKAAADSGASGFERLDEAVGKLKSIAGSRSLVKELAELAKGAGPIAGWVFAATTAFEFVQSLDHGNDSIREMVKLTKELDDTIRSLSDKGQGVGATAEAAAKIAAKAEHDKAIAEIDKKEDEARGRGSDENSRYASDMETWSKLHEARKLVEENYQKEVQEIRRAEGQKEQDEEQKARDDELKQQEDLRRDNMEKEKDAVAAERKIAADKAQARADGLKVLGKDLAAENVLRKQQLEEQLQQIEEDRQKRLRDHADDQTRINQQAKQASDAARQREKADEAAAAKEDQDKQKREADQKHKAALGDAEQLRNKILKDKSSGYASAQEAGLTSGFASAAAGRQTSDPQLDVLNKLLEQNKSDSKKFDDIVKALNQPMF